MGRKGKPSALLVGMQTGAATMENNRHFPQKFKMDLPCNPAILLLRLYPKNFKCQYERIMHPNVHSSVSYNSQVLETAYVPISK